MSQTFASERRCTPLDVIPTVEPDVFEAARAAETTLLLSDDPVRDYYNRLTEPLLEPEEEQMLAKQIEAGLWAAEKLRIDTSGSPDKDLLLVAREGKTAKKRFIEANFRLVVSIAEEYQGHGLSFLDLIQEGNVGLIRGVEMFDYAKGYKFSTYGSLWIRKEILRALAEHSRPIRVSDQTHDDLVKLSKAEKQLAAEFGRQPTHAQLAARLEVPEAKVRELQGHNYRMISIDRPGADEDPTFNNSSAALATNPNNEDLARAEERRVRAFLGGALTPKLLQVFVPFVLGQRPADLARALSLPPATVNSRIKYARQKVRDIAPTNDDLKAQLDQFRSYPD